MSTDQRRRSKRLKVSNAMPSSSENETPSVRKPAASKASKSSPPFHATATAAEARSLTDGVQLASAISGSNNNRNDDAVIMPWIGYGTYKLGEKHSYRATLQALESGYRCIDTAFVYARETTEASVGRALQTALKRQVMVRDRSDVFVITKQWRSHHGYQATMECLKKSLKRLQLDYVDLYLMHWPGPGYNTLNRRKDVMEREGPWAYANVRPEDMVRVRAETWRAMEDLMMEQGKARAIGVSNFTIQHLETLKETARVWPPAVNQVECHPLHPQNELRAYCEREGIVLQAYAALGGQDGTKKKWNELLGDPKTTLRTCPVVERLAEAVHKTPSQVLLRYALQRNCAVTPKTASPERMVENAQVFDFSLSKEQMDELDSLEVEGMDGRLCWRTDPLRLLEFD